jgi:hypothetical protein
MTQPWGIDTPGVLTLPSGRQLRGRGLRTGLLPRRLDGGHQQDELAPELGLYLLGRQPTPTAWESRWLRWRDFGLPSDPAAARTALVEAWERSDGERVEIACGGGVGRTGTALACVFILDGGRPADAVDYVRQHYHRRAVETRGQRRYILGFA